jgi:hypothetical protein
MRVIQLCSSIMTAAALLLSGGCETHKSVYAADTATPQYRVFDTVVVHTQPVQDELTIAGRMQANPTTVVHIYPRSVAVCSHCRFCQGRRSQKARLSACSRAPTCSRPVATTRRRGSKLPAPTCN